MNDPTLVRRDLTHTVLSVIFISLLVALTCWILSPLLVSLVWGTVIAVATWPVLQRLQTWFGNRKGLAVGSMAVVLLLLVIIPMMFAVLTIANNANNITLQIRSFDPFTESTPPEWIKRIPVAGAKIADRWVAFAALSSEQRSEVILPYAQSALKWLAARAGGAPVTIIHFVLTMVIVIVLYAKGEIFRDGILRFARRLAGRQGEDVAILAARAMRGVVLGVAGTALVQAAVAGLGLWISGVPAAGLLTAVTLFLCLAQLGPLLVLLPAVIWLFWTGQSVWGTVLVVFAVFAGTIDNILRPLLIKKGVDLPLLLIFAGVIGGLVAFGIIGLFIAPVILAVSYTLLTAWVSGEVKEDNAGSIAE